MLSRPTVKEILNTENSVNLEIEKIINNKKHLEMPLALIELGIHQQPTASRTIIYGYKIYICF